jgi:hypothetical protein
VGSYFQVNVATVYSRVNPRIIRIRRIHTRVMIRTHEFCIRGKIRAWRIQGYGFARIWIWIRKSRSTDYPCHCLCLRVQKFHWSCGTCVGSAFIFLCRPAQWKPHFLPYSAYIMGLGPNENLEKMGGHSPKHWEQVSNSHQVH